MGSLRQIWVFLRDPVEEGSGGLRPRVWERQREAEILITVEVAKRWKLAERTLSVDISSCESHLRG